MRRRFGEVAALDGLSFEVAAGSVIKEGRAVADSTRAMPKKTSGTEDLERASATLRGAGIAVHEPQIQPRRAA